MPRLTSVPLNRAMAQRLLAQERRQDSGLDDFINSLASYPKPTAAENRYLCEKAQRGDKTARDQLVERNLRLVLATALPYINQGVPLMDLIQEGSIGLMAAIDKYDPDRDAKFSTHAAWMIHDAVRRAAQAQGKTIYIPQRVQEQSARVRKAEHAAESHGEALSDDELAKRAGVSLEHLARVRTAETLRPLSLDYETADGYTLADRLPAEHSLYEEAVEQERIETLYRHLRYELTATEREIVYLRYGLQSAYREHSLEEIAAEVGMSRRQVKLHHDTAIVKLRIAYGRNPLDGSEPSEEDEADAA